MGRLVWLRLSLLLFTVTVLKRKKKAIMKPLLFPVFLFTILVSNFFGQEVKKYQVKYFEKSFENITSNAFI